MILNHRQKVSSYMKSNFWKYPVALLLLTFTLSGATETDQATLSVGGDEAAVGQRSSTPSVASASENQQHQIVDRHGSEEKEEAKTKEQPQENQDSSEDHKALLAKISDDTGHNGKHWEVSKMCLNCLCYFATDCDLKRQCETPDPSDNLEPGMEKGDCGPFHISLPFWADGNNKEMILGDAVMENEWKRCSLDLECATESIQKYFHKYPIDCNRDGKVDCIDYAAIHTLGPFGCQNLKALTYWNKNRRGEMLECMVKHEEGVYTKKMQELEEKMKRQDIAARKNEHQKEEKKSTDKKNSIPEEVEHKTEIEVNSEAENVKAKSNSDETFAQEHDRSDNTQGGVVQQ